MSPSEFIKHHLNQVDREIGNYKVLFIDDERLNLKYFKKVTKVAEVLCAINGEEALDLINKYQNNIALVLADQHMPGLQGHEILKIVSEQCPHAVRMIVTGSISIGRNWEKRDAIKLAIDISAMDVIEKPWSGYDMEKVIRTAIRYYIYRKQYNQGSRHIREYYSAIIKEYQSADNPPLNQELQKKIALGTIGAMDLIPDRLLD